MKTIIEDTVGLAVMAIMQIAFIIYKVTTHVRS